MGSVFDKLTRKGQTELFGLNVPDSFEPELAALSGIAVHRKSREAKEITFALVFVLTQQEIEAAARVISRKARGDALIWFAYPKGSSR